MDYWWEQLQADWQSWAHPGALAHPNSLDGGTGPGFSHNPPFGNRLSDPVHDRRTLVERALEWRQSRAQQSIQHLTGIQNWEELQFAARTLLGPKTFGLGVAFGIVQNIAVSAAQLFSLQKMFVLAELYDVLHAQTPWEHAAQSALDAALPFAAGFHGLALLLTHSHFLSLHDLEEAHLRRQALLSEFGKIFHDPGAFFSSLGTSMKADYHSRWYRFTQLMAEPSLVHQFEAGVIFGGLLLDVVLLLLTVIDGVGIAIKLAKEVPELLRVVQALARVDRAGHMVGGSEAAEALSAEKNVVAPNRSFKPGEPPRNWSYQPKQSGRLEPGAIRETPEYQSAIDNSLARTASPAPEGWPQMLDRDAQTFGTDPSPETIPPGTKLYRVIDQDRSGAGSYWSLQPPPASEAEWRGGSAVLDNWNGDGGYVTSTVPDSGLNAWVGSAAPQRLKDGFALPGGDTQVWVPQGTVVPDGLPQPTPWNPH